MLLVRPMSPVASIRPPWYHTEEGRKLGKLRSSGRATYCTEVRIVDPEGQEVPRGPNVMQGYWNKPELTAAALQDGWTHTGNGGKMDEDGFISVVDRIKVMIKTCGDEVYSAEVENALAQHPAVSASAVIGIPSEQWGEAVHAVVVRKPGHDVSATELMTPCKTLIAGYKSPLSIDFMDAQPLSGAGKVLKSKLREKFWQGRDRGVA